MRLLTRKQLAEQYIKIENPTENHPTTGILIAYSFLRQGQVVEARKELEAVIHTLGFEAGDDPKARRAV